MLAILDTVPLSDINLAMNLEFYLQDTSASVFQYQDCDAQQLDSLARQVTDISDRIKAARKGLSILSILQARLSNRQSVRCTVQSVEITATARYAPSTSDMDLSHLDLATFVGLVSYLPLPDLRNLISNVGATRKATEIWRNQPLDSRWAIYFTRLSDVNKQWADVFSKGLFCHIRLLQLTFGGNAEVYAYSTALGESQGYTNGPTGRGAETMLTPRRSQDDIVDNTTCSHHPRSDSGQDIPSADAIETNAVDQDEILLQRVINAKRRAWGPEHPTTVDSILNLTILYISHQKHAEAKELLLQGLNSSSYDGATLQTCNDE